jgi:hypothetical protein
MSLCGTIDDFPDRAIAACHDQCGKAISYGLRRKFHKVIGVLGNCQIKFHACGAQGGFGIGPAFLGIPAI